MKHGHRHDESSIIQSARIDDSVDYSVLRFSRRGVSDCRYLYCCRLFALRDRFADLTQARETYRRNGSYAEHFLWSTLISGWGLDRLEFVSPVIIVGAITTILVVSYGFARLGVAIGKIST